MKRTLFFSLSLFMLLLAATLYIACTSQGLQYTVSLGKYFLPGKLSIERIEGKLISEVNITNLNYQTIAKHYQIKTLTFNWNFNDLIRGLIHIKRLRATDVKITQLKSNNSIPSLPKRIIVDDLLIKHITIKKNDKTTHINTLSFSGRSTKKQFIINKLKIRSDELFIHGNGTITRRAPYPVDLDLIAENTKASSNKFHAVANIHGNTKKLSLKVNVIRPFSLTINGTINLTGIKPFLNLQAKWKHLQWPIFHEAKYISRNGELTIQGPLNHYQVNLNTDLSGPSFSDTKLQLSAEGNKNKIKIKFHDIYVPSNYITLHKIQLIMGFSKQFITSHLDMQSGGGSLTMDGKIHFKQRTIHADLKISGEKFQIKNTPEYKIWVSPTLDLIIKGRNLHLTGTLRIPKAKIQPHDFSNALNMPHETEFVGETPPSLPINFSSDIHLIIDNSVSFQGMGLQTNLSGELDITDPPSKMTTARGELQLIHGKYLAYGEYLTIDRGRLLFAGGPITNPGLNIKASRRITSISDQGSFFNQSNIPILDQIAEPTLNNIIVGILVRGTLHTPKISFFSNPANIPQADILSYLVLGRPLNRVSQADSGLLFKAISALNISGKGGALSQINQQLQHNFGLDELDLRTATKRDPKTGDIIDTTSIVLGKALSPRLYLSYTFGLTEANQWLRIRYLLGKHWTIQSETNGVANSIDLLYTREMK